MNHCKTILCYLTRYFSFLKQPAINGEYNVNREHFSKYILSSLCMEINGNTFASISSSFPNNVTNLFYHTLSNLRYDKNVLTHQSFKIGRTRYSWDLRTKDCNCGDQANVENPVMLELIFRTDTPVTENYFVFVIGITTASIEIDGARRVKNFIFDLNEYEIDSILNSLAETKYLFHGYFKNDTICFELHLKRNAFFIVNISVKISSTGH